jgi:hypothetical protein
VKEFLFQIKKRIKRLMAFEFRKIQRLANHNKINQSNSFHIPIIINNRNRYTYLKQLVDWLTHAGYTNLYILDNDSTYPPVLEYYKVTPAKIIYLNKNSGYKALWLSDFFDRVKEGYYAYTDADVLPDKNCPNDVVFQLYLKLVNYSHEKCGPALKIDDLPDHYKHKLKVIQNETPFWIKPIEENVFQAPIDTTFALYKPFAYGNADECSAIRVGGDLTFLHQPWYENSNQPDEETSYYVSHSSDSSFWYNKVEKHNT